jgi:3-hydroxyacyl-CoA dehydrogenase/3a,7a,12a-trihydroxy-5b-cholest-24-enoyl-CoA hydratase
MSGELRFDDQVVIITGAGNGLGRAHALLFASRGARVVVNDLGGSATGEGSASAAADRVVDEIRGAGGEAVANHDSVEFGERIVQTAIDTWGRVDVVVNNAGILRDRSFQKMSDEDWRIVHLVHVLGAFRVAHAAWPYFREQGYGRLVNTSSAAGIYGNFGQANYGAAKLALVGFSNTLAIEGLKRNIHANTIAPLAASRLTKGLVPDAMFDALSPELVSPLVLWLCHRDCQETGGLFEVGGGFFAKLRWERAAGRMYRLGRPVTAEALRESWADITDFQESTHPQSVAASMSPIVENLSAGPTKGGNRFIDVDLALGYEFPAAKSAYTERDVSLYALGVGAGDAPLQDSNLQLVYENHGQGFKVLPTFIVAPVIKMIIAQVSSGSMAPGLHFGLDRLLHGEQYTELIRPMPPAAKLTHRSKVTDIFDKGKGALVIIETGSFDEEGDLIARNVFTAFIRGAGGWGGDRGPSSEINVPPDRTPDVVTEQQVAPNQGLLYRLSGDGNPLHVDPGFAKAFGFERPILHGLCTYGYVARHVIDAFSGGDPRYFKSIQVRFAGSVFPGETLVTEMWKESKTRIVFRCKVAERDQAVITHAAVELYEVIPEKAPRKAASVEAPAEQGPTSAAAFLGIGVHIERHPELVDQIGKVFTFVLSEPDSAWTLDLKNAPGSATPGADANADCTLSLSDADFMRMSSGEADPMKLYMDGKLKISGDLMASQRLSFLQEVDPADVADEVAHRLAAGPVPQKQAATARKPAAPGIFEALKTRLAQDAALAGREQALLQFSLSAPESHWTVDLRGQGSVKEGTVQSATTTFALEDEHLAALVAGEISARDLFQRGQLRIDGDVRQAHNLEFLVGLR